MHAIVLRVLRGYARTHCGNCEVWTSIIPIPILFVLLQRRVIDGLAPSGLK